jgi:hypothetical protein
LRSIDSANLPKVSVVNSGPPACGAFDADRLLPAGEAARPRAVLFRTGWVRAPLRDAASTRRGAPVSPKTRHARPALVRARRGAGRDQPRSTLDDTAAGAAPSTPRSLRAGIPIVEHLTVLRGAAGDRFTLTSRFARSSVPRPWEPFPVCAPFRAGALGRAGAGDVPPAPAPRTWRRWLAPRPRRGPAITRPKRNRSERERLTREAYTAPV